VTRQQRLQAVREGLKRTAGGNSLPDELIGRLMSRIIVFDGLTKEMARLIIEPRLAEISRRLRELHGVQFEYKSGLSDVVQQLLSTDGGLGARDLTGRLTILEEDALALQWVAEGTGSRTLQLRVIDGELQVVTV
jgi:ATP-dependent Clp protease ATP-binding subunit ClpA